jgi:hypothetical protein
MLFMGQDTNTDGVMKIAYLILAHNNPGHLSRLTRALTAQNNAVFIHIDKKADIRPF